MSLPKWIEKSYPWDSHDDGLKVLEALSIAMEALEKIKDPNWNNPAAVITAGEALSRIKEMGDTQ